MEKLSLKGLKFETTEIIIKDNIMTITLARPEKKNAMNNVMMNEINYALAYAKQENSIRVVIIAAKGDIFCSGADLSRSESDSNVPKLEDFDDISLSLRHLYKSVIFFDDTNISSIKAGEIKVKNVLPELLNCKPSFNNNIFIC